MDTVYLGYDGYWICPICCCSNYYSEIDIIIPGEPEITQCEHCCNDIKVEL